MYLDDEQQQRLQEFLSQYSDAMTTSGLLGDTGAGVGSAAAFQGLGDGLQSTFQAQTPNAPVAPTAPEAADTIPGIVPEGGSDIAKEMVENGQASQLQGNGMLNALRQADLNAIQSEDQRNKGGGLLGSLLKIGINTALGNWLGGVGSRALGTVGDGFNKAFKIKK